MGAGHYSIVHTFFPYSQHFFMISLEKYSLNLDAMQTMQADYEYIKHSRFS